MDDTDTRFDITNRGLSGKPYYVEVYDYEKPDAPYWNGITSNFWNLLDLAFPDEKIASMKKMFKAMEELSGSNADTSYKKVMAFYDKYFWSKAQDYFPHTAYNADAKYCYEDGKLAYNAGSYSNDTDPITQSLGDHYLAEKRWVSKRIIYMMSKYNMGDFVHNAKGAITFRAKGYNIDFQITPAINMYPTLANGTSIVEGTRTEAGEVCNVSVPLGGAGDQQIAILGADYLLDIGDWYDKQAFSSMIISGSRLTDIRLGHATEPITIDIDSLTISNCVSLQRLDLTRIWNLQSSLDLSACTHLKEILFKGTQLTDVTFPDTGFLEKIELGSKVMHFKLLNQNRITSNNISFEDKSSIKTLWVENSKNIDAIAMLKTLPSVTHIRLFDIDESVDSFEDMEFLLNYGGIDSNGDYTEKPVVSGKVHLGTMYEEDEDIMKSYFPNIEFTYDTYIPTPIRTLKIKSNTNAVLEGVKVEALGNIYYSDANGEVKIKSKNGGLFKFEKGGYIPFETTLGNITADTTNDITLYIIPTRTINIKDSSGNFITDVTVTDEKGYSFVCTTGSFTNISGTADNSITYTFTKSGYESKTQKFNHITVNTTHNVFLENLYNINIYVKFTNGNPVKNATVTIGSESKLSDNTGLAQFGVVNGTYSYSVTYNVDTQSGSVTVNNSDVSVNIDSFEMSIEELKPIPNGNLQMLVEATMTTNTYIQIYNGNGSVIDWGDGTTSTISGSSSAGKNMFHTYASVGLYQIEISKHSTITGINTDVDIVSTGGITIVALWTIGNNNNIVNLKFKNNTKLEIVGDDIFKNDITRTSFDECFYGCSSLSSIPSGLFDNCTNVTSMRRAFYGCIKIEEIPSGLFDKCKKINSYYSCFYGCSGLISIPSGLFQNTTNSPSFDYCFYRCSKVVNIPDDLFDYIGTPINHSFSSTFSNNISLLNGVIPAFVRFNIGYMYSNCGKLKYMIVKPTTPPTYSNTITGNSTFRVYVPDASVNTYKNASGWSGFADRIFPMTQFETDFPQI